MVQTLDVISVNFWQIIISLANLLILFLMFKKFLFKPVKNILAKRDGEIEMRYTEADNAKAAAEESREKYEAKLSGANEEADAIIASANESATFRSEKIVEEANMKAQSIMRKAENEAELELIAQFAQKGKRILGICRGLQIINVFFGGTLCQSIVSTTVHAGKNDALHTVTAEKDSILYSLYGREFISNSNHHQAIGELGAGLRITATCESVIEAVEHVECSISAVQFHPERMLTAHTADGAMIFNDFIKKIK